MSNSPLVTYTRLSPNRTSPRNHAIDTITIHCMAGNASVETCGALFARASTEASSNYGIGSDGRVALYVDEGDRSWASSNGANDHRAVTIEVANSGGEPDWPVSDQAYAALIDLCVDICRRNGIQKLLWRGDKSLVGQVDKQNMTAHRWFAAKACPGDYLYSRFGDIVARVNERLEEEHVTQEQFNEMMEVYLTQQRSKESSSWSQEAWKKAETAGVFDGSAPQAPLSREQASLVLDRLGLLPEGGG